MPVSQWEEVFGSREMEAVLLPILELNGGERQRRREAKVREEFEKRGIRHGADRSVVKGNRHKKMVGERERKRESSMEEISEGVEIEKYGR